MIYVIFAYVLYFADIYLKIESFFQENFSPGEYFLTLDIAWIISQKEKYFYLNKG